MRYYQMTSGGLLMSVGTGGTVGEEITESKYTEILSIIRNRPTAPDGYGYRLTTELEWELYELPITETDEEATEADYQNALRELGVEV